MEKSDSLKIELLIVEDDDEFISVILKHLHGTGVEFDCARSVQEALKCLSETTYKVISFDVFLGQENCGKILQYLKQNVENKNNQSHILICSAAANEDFIARMVTKGYKVFSKQEHLDAYFCLLNQLVERDVKEEFSNALDALLA